MHLNLNTNVLNWIEGKQNFTIKMFVLIKISMRQALELIFLEKFLDLIEKGVSCDFFVIFP